MHLENLKRRHRMFASYLEFKEKIIDKFLVTLDKVIPSVSTHIFQKRIRNTILIQKSALHKFECAF